MHLSTIEHARFIGWTRSISGDRIADGRWTRTIGETLASRFEREPWILTLCVISRSPIHTRGDLAFATNACTEQLATHLASRTVAVYALTCTVIKEEPLVAETHRAAVRFFNGFLGSRAKLKHFVLVE
jgi:hypothetical protein